MTIPLPRCTKPTDPDRAAAHSHRVGDASLKTAAPCGEPDREDERADATRAAYEAALAEDPAMPRRAWRAATFAADVSRETMCNARCELVKDAVDASRPTPERAIWPHAIAALTRARDAAGPHDSARYILSQLVIAFTGAGEMLAAGHVDGAADLLADVEPQQCDGCRKPLDASAETTGEAEAVTLCPACLEIAKKEAAKRCQICGWPFAADRENGCVPGDCSYRPETGSDEHRRITARREALARAPCPTCERPRDPKDCCQA